MLLSILIPAYSYPAGILRICSVLEVQADPDLEVIIFDDSSDGGVQRLLDVFSFGNLNLHYYRNDPPLGPANNWNSLVNAATGKYCLLMHHDEFPIGFDFIDNALQELRCSQNTDVLMLNCLLVSGDGTVARRHVPQYLRSLVIRYQPSYLFRRNVIGPTACLIIRRSIYPKFDENLKWFIDVDAYFCLRQSTSRWKNSKCLQIGSLLGRIDSITATITYRLREIESEEIIYLSKKHSNVTMWRRTLFSRLHHLIESVSWYTMRIFTRLYGVGLNLLGYSPVSKSLLKKMLKL
jgi:glycosyltransferase involved in cell wall biosynthesis